MCWFGFRMERKWSQNHMTYSVTIFLSRYLLTGTAAMKAAAAAAIAAIISRVNRVMFVYIWWWDWEFVCVCIFLSRFILATVWLFTRKRLNMHKIIDRQEARAHKLIEQLNDLHSHFDGALNVGIIE